MRSIFARLQTRVQAQKRSLTLPSPGRKSNDKVLPFPNSLYAQWRLEGGAVPFLHEPGESPPERLLQAIWQHQRLRRDQLRSLDGETVRILHPGFPSREGGPDFRGAVVQFGSASPKSGDVEVDIHAGGWHAHGHDRNPSFGNVVLHVIWDGGCPTPGAPATVAIASQLDAPVGELTLWLSAENEGGLPEHLRGKCTTALRKLSTVELARLLHEAAQIRFHSKAARFQARARRVGWDQALWEGIFRALGYKHNAWPMQCLAEQRPHWLTPRVPAMTLQARLFGISGLLPLELTRAQASADGYLRRVWDQWWREREEFRDDVVPRSLWRFHGQRPANHPQRRLALAAHWLAARDFIPKIERWCAATVPDTALADSLLETLQVGSDPFWSWHWTVRSARLKRPQPLLGTARATDLGVNVILPWLWVRAVEGKNEEIQQVIEHRFKIWPPAEDNAVLRFARQRLLGDAPRRLCRTAAEQQGLMQIVRDFCDRSDAVCRGCRFPSLVGGR